MAKALPYFKFYCSEWSDGDITLEDMKTQGVFINICSYYWSQECDILEEKLQKKFKNYSKQIENLKKEKIIFSVGDKIEIKFLDKQWQERELIKQRNKQNGASGGRPKKTQSVNSGKPTDNPNITNIEEKRREENKSNKKEPCKHSENIKEILTYLNNKLGSKFRTANGLKARLTEGFTVIDAKKVIDIKFAEWIADEKMRQYLRPDTLFGTKFDSYLNQESQVQQAKAFNPIDLLN